MRTLEYHEGQRAIQEEANTIILADNLAHWHGPIADFALGADLLIFAFEGEDDALRFSMMSGAAPLVEIAGPSAIRLLDGAELDLPEGITGGLAISLATARRVRINGFVDRADGVVVQADEGFTLCRKYMAPSLALDGRMAAGPVAREAVPLDDEGLRTAVAAAETAFLGSITPGGAPDVAHRGGPAGFLELDAGAGTLAWVEYLGDGVFKSAGNVRATGTCTMLVPDFATGDGYELVCDQATYENVRTSRRERVDPLIQDKQPFPVQGLMRARVVGARRLRGLTHPRERLAERQRFTSQSLVDDQAPQ